MISPGAPRRSTAVGLYVHLPFCASRCAYCTFVASTEIEQMPRLLDATTREVARLASRRRRLSSLYLGGGTPSLVPGGRLHALAEAVHEAFTWLPGAEFTLEANPDDVDHESLGAWQRSGVTRLSIGVQSFVDAVLRLLQRRHGATDARRAVELALAAGFEVSLDLMLGLPGMSVSELTTTLETVLRLRPHHVSVYLLEMDKPHALGDLARRHPHLFPDADAAAAQYLATGRALVAAGYVHYEISSFALPGHLARHNLRYWLQRPVLAAGVAAHGQSGRQRWANHSELRDYIAAVERGRPPLAWSRRLDGDELTKERVMLGLRLARGVVEEEAERCARLAPSFAGLLDDFLALGLARRRAGRIRFTPRGWLVSNELLAALW